MRSIRLKLILLTSLLIVALVGTTSYLLIKEKETDLTFDIYRNTLNYSDLTSDEIVNLNNQLLSQQNFVSFNIEISQILKRTADIEKIQITDFNGNILYDSKEEELSQYSGTEQRKVEAGLVERIQSNNPSARSNNNQTVFLKKDSSNNFYAVNRQEQQIENLEKDAKIKEFVYPVDNEFAVIYTPDYNPLVLRIEQTTHRIILMTILSIIIGIILAYFFASTITRPLKKLTKAVQIIAKGDFKHKVKVKVKDEVGILAKNVNQMGSDLDKSTKALIYEEKVKKELELAAKIQTNLLPEEIPAMKGLKVAIELLQADEIGGDCYDFIERKGEHFFYMGDVTGHGIAASLVVSIVNSMLYGESQTEQDMIVMCENTNRILHAKTAQNIFVTAILFTWDGSKLEYVSAGHEQIIIYRAKDNKTEINEPDGIALGLLPDTNGKLKKKSLDLKKGDFAVIYTDGIPEARNKKDEEYGLESFQKSIEKNAKLNDPDKIKDGIISDLKEFTKGENQSDDITCMIIMKD